MAHGPLLPKPKTPLLRMGSTAAALAMAFTPHRPHTSTVGHPGWGIRLRHREHPVFESSSEYSPYMGHTRAITHGNSGEVHH